MAMHRELSAAAEHVQRACGQLDRRYDKPDAVALMRVLEECDSLVGRALPFESTWEQQVLRRELHLQATSLAAAIRGAISCLSLVSDRDDVVVQTRRLRGTLLAFRVALAAGRFAPANDDQREYRWPMPDVRMVTSA
jgi:hypothetical protein